MANAAKAEGEHRDSLCGEDGASRRARERAQRYDERLRRAHDTPRLHIVAHDDASEARQLMREWPTAVDDAAELDPLPIPRLLPLARR